MMLAGLNTSAPLSVTQTDGTVRTHHADFCCDITAQAYDYQNKIWDMNCNVLANDLCE